MTSHYNQIIQTDVHGAKLRELKDAIINELHGKMTGIIRDYKLSCSIQTKSQLKTPLLFIEKKLNY